MDLPVLHQLGIGVGLCVLCGVAAQSFGGWVVAAGLQGLAAFAGALVAGVGILSLWPV